MRIVEVSVEPGLFERGHIPECAECRLAYRPGRHRAPRYRDPGEIPGARAQARHRQGHHRRPVRRQQQLVRRLGRLGVQAATDLTNVKLLDGGRKKWEADKRPFDTRVAQVTPSKVHRRRAQHEAARPARRRERRRVRKKVECNHRRYPLGRRVFRQDLRAGRFAGTAQCAPAMSRVRSTSRGGAPSTKTAPSSRPAELKKLYGRCRHRRQSSRSSPTAASASARATPGSCCRQILGYRRAQLRRLLDRIRQHRRPAGRQRRAAPSGAAKGRI